MALGTNYQNGNNANQTYDPSYYSRLRIKNAKDKTGLTFTFWKGTLKISIINTEATDKNNSEIIFIHLSPTKARILSDGVHRVMKNSESSDVFGVDTGIGETRGFIAIGREMGTSFLFIAKVDSNGNYLASQRFAFNSSYHYLLKVHNIVNLEYQKEYNDNVELQEFADLLDDYARSASGALGASFYDIGRYENGKVSGMIKKIAEKVGVSNSFSGNGNGGSSFFSNNDYSNKSSERTNNNTQQSSNRRSYQTIDDLESELG